MSGLFPDWVAFTPEVAARELPRLVESAERGVADIEASDPLGFEDLEWRLEDATRPLWECWGMVAHMASVMNSEEWRRIEEDFQPKIVEF